MVLSVSISSHTTTSFPRPHILYIVQVDRDGKLTFVERRYSEFLALNDAIGARGINLPPKRILVTTFVPSAWVDDQLIAERKAGLAKYLSNVVQIPEYENHPALLNFLKGSSNPSRQFHLEDALPSTLSRKTALDLKNRVEAEASDPIAAAYYPDWSVWSNPPENIDFSKFDIVFFAFATPNQSSGLDWDSGSQDTLRRLVNAARNSGTGTKIVLSVGGWGGSKWFSQAVSNDQNRGTFVNALVNATNSFNLSGVDIDWEYPNSNGAGNPHGPGDANNLLKLFQGLRAALGPDKIISAAVPHLPWIGSNGSPLTNISAWAKEMTYINIMNYDVWGASANPGPNAPLNDGCGTSTQPQASAEAAFNQWTAAGAPANKLLLGLPLYGYVSQSTRTTLTGSFAPSTDMVLLQQDADNKNFLNGSHARTRPKQADSAPTTAAADLRGWYGQQISFKALVEQGALVKDGDGNYRAGGGFTMAWDDCSDTPFMYNVSQATVVTYDDTWSLGDKAQFARDHSMAGCFTWSLDQDDGVSLQNVIRDRLGK
ncbi:glycoside hydrolase family 18 protein [Moniliophthora roreri MCA 2997]|uniref:Glycoside hydrolase family 18 protein n=2 Tax=Moniliophthora roreri TaxID=221103 RepID=V2XAG0_MONRO|nr:glycoside hydrolase family 18 protein [Moniliophthora roreri MCA 2997]